MATNSPFVNKVFTINRKDRALAFLIQMVIAAINLVLLMALVVGLIVYRDNLQAFRAFIIYFLYGFYILVYIAFSLAFYLHLKPNLNDKERSYFRAAAVQAIFGINFFTSAHFYLKSGLSPAQKSAAILIIKRRNIKKVVARALAQKKLTKLETNRIQTLLLIAKNNDDTQENVANYIMKLLLAKKISTSIEIGNQEIIDVGRFL